MEPSIDQFVMTLPSDSEDRNTPSNFRTRLPVSLAFDEGWEVALYSIIYPHSWPNVPAANKIICTSQSPDENFHEDQEYSIPSGWYGSTDLLIRTISATINAERKRNIEMLYHTTERKVYFNITQGDQIKFDETLAGLLGVNAYESISTTKKGDYPVGLISNLTAIYVYTDIIQSQITGNVNSSLLQLIPIQGGPGQILQHSPIRPLYLPLRTNIVSTVTIELATNLGHNIEFGSGQVIVQLHFRKATRYQ
jgi:hypothetical protein